MLLLAPKGCGFPVHLAISHQGVSPEESGGKPPEASGAIYQTFPFKTLDTGSDAVLETKQLPIELPPVISSRTNSLGIHSHWDFLGNKECKLEKRQHQHRSDSELSESEHEFASVFPRPSN